MKAIVLAAGKGSRMLSDGPKCCQEVCGKPMINRVVDTLKEVGFSDIIVVVGYKAEQVKELLGDTVTYAYQKNQVGTADAVWSTKELIDDEDVLITLGDMPFIKVGTFQAFVDAYKQSKPDMLMGTFINEGKDLAYGRIIKKGDMVVDVIEDRDCSESQKQIKELNVSLYATHSSKLYAAIKKIDNNNKQKEYYLTDIVKKYNENNLRVIPFVLEDRLEIQGLNTMEEIYLAEKELVKRF